MYTLYLLAYKASTLMQAKTEKSQGHFPAAFFVLFKMWYESELQAEAHFPLLYLLRGE